MNVLITSSRMPFALGEIRRFGEQGHRVFTTDTFKTAPGSHSALVTRHMVTASPHYQTARFISDLRRIITQNEIDMLVPQFEEMFYIAACIDKFRGLSDVFLPPFETLVDFHDKARFVRLATHLSIRTPRTTIVTCCEDLRRASEEYGQYFARAAYSRGGVTLLTNVGPLAGSVRIDECSPSGESPWIVQEFVHGVDLCSFSVARQGRVSVHCAYSHPKTIEHAGGIQFVSVEEPGTLDIVQRFASATNYTGQISFDYLKDERGLSMVECNPRPTDGVVLMPSKMLVDGVLGDMPPEPRVLEAGRKVQIDVAIIRDMIRSWKEIPADIEALVSTPDLYLKWQDLLPALYQFLSYSHILAYRHFLHTDRHNRKDILEAQFYDICWDGEPIECG